MTNTRTRVITDREARDTARAYAAGLGSPSHLFAATGRIDNVETLIEDLADGCDDDVHTVAEFAELVEYIREAGPRFYYWKD